MRHLALLPAWRELALVKVEYGFGQVNRKLIASPLKTSALRPLVLQHKYHLEG